MERGNCMEPRMDFLSGQEQAVLSLRALYESFGYRRFPVRRFEEYGLYLENKNFLKSESVLAFPNAKGQLMALRPDVTLSIVKHVMTRAGQAEKLYYQESVYRVSETDHEFAEIQQMGVEYLGDADGYGALEVIRLAAESLRAMGGAYVLEIGHMGFADGLMEAAGLTDAQKEELFGHMRRKSGHELWAALARMGIAPGMAGKIEELAGLSGDFVETLEKSEALATGPAMAEAREELRRLWEALAPLGLGDCLRLDFSLLNDLDYYNGLVFHGYLEGAPRAVLSGGRYDRLVRKFGKEGGGIGFALYLDEVARLLARPTGWDVDVLLLYEERDRPAAVLKAVDALREKGQRVMAAKRPQKGLKAGETLRLPKDGGWGAC